MATLFSRWIPQSFPFFDGEIKLKLRALDKRQSPEFIREVTALSTPPPPVPGETPEEAEARDWAYIEKAEAAFRSYFERYVRLVEPVQESEDGEPVGEQIVSSVGLWEITDRAFWGTVTAKLAALASVDDTRAKSSGSPSTSTVEAGRTSTDFPAPNTASEASPVSSTATVPTEAEESCSVPV